MKIPLVDLGAQYRTIQSEIDRAMSEVISTGAFVGGHYVEMFERDYAAFCSARHCIAVGNGTDALFIALKALGVGPGDQVITAANSFIATSEAITMTGARVVFADIDPKTYNIDTHSIEKRITERTRALVPVHLYGQPADMREIMSLAHRYALKVVEDAAQAHGAAYAGQPVGTFGDAGCFSFYPSKNLGAYGDGGAIITDDDVLARTMRMFANHGSLSKYDHEFEGVNSRLDGLQAAILRAKLSHLRDWTEARRAVATRYNRLLVHPTLVTPVEVKDRYAVYHLYVIRVSGNRRDALQQHLASKGISTGVHYPIPLPALKAYSYLNHSQAHFEHATLAAAQLLSLPMYPEITEAQVGYVVDHVLEFCDAPH